MTMEEERREHLNLYDLVDIEPDIKDTQDAHIDDAANGDDDDECLDLCSEVSDLDYISGEGGA